MEREEKLALIRADLRENNHYVDGYFEFSSDDENEIVGAYVIPIGLPAYQGDAYDDRDAMKKRFFKNVDFSTWQEWYFRNGEMLTEVYCFASGAKQALDKLPLFEELVTTNQFENYMNEEELLSYRYQLLGRLKSDIDYLLNHGSFEAKDKEYTKRVLDNKLWGGTTNHFAKMIELLEGFSERNKPDWYTMQDLEKDKMKMENLYGMVLG